MNEPHASDEATLVWTAALVEDVEPAQVAAEVDVAALAAVVAEAAAEPDPVDAAATLLVGLVRRRPFPSSNTAIGWLAAVDRLAGSQLRITADPDAVVELCDAVRAGAAGAAEAAATMRAWVAELGLPCPACGRRVYAHDARIRRLVPPGGGTTYELTARCAHEHGRHDRAGRPIAAPPAHRHEPSQPILANGECGSFLVTGGAGSVVVSPYCDDPPLVRVVEVDDLRAGDLVGRWDALVERSTTLGVVPADEAVPDERGRVDLRRLRRALPAGGRRSGATGPAPVRQHVGSR